jgi:hypothetical protein
MNETHAVAFERLGDRCAWQLLAGSSVYLAGRFAPMAA